MLYLALFLHFYQPPTQFPQITKKIAQESYEKILKLVQNNKNARLTVNFTASLTQQLVNLGLKRIINGFKELGKEKRIELTGSAAYHPFLPRLPKEEIERQIRLNEEINRKYFGPSFAKTTEDKGFFPPEMAYSPEVGEVVERLGFKWIILDESAIKTKDTSVDGKQMIYLKKNSNLAIFARNKELSLAIAFSKIRTVKEFLNYLSTTYYLLSPNYYLILAMDGETFGHHQPGQLKFLEEILKAPSSIRQLADQVPIKFLTISELFDLFPEREEIEPKTSTWGESWKRWDNPDNSIHKLQWKLFNLALRVKCSKAEAKFCENDARSRTIYANERKVRSLLDRGLHSDQFWWASGKPFWHPKMIERGARMLRDVVLLSGAQDEEKTEAKKLYDDIITTGRRLHGEKIVPC